MSILVTGGAGYIGSHMVRMLRHQNIEAVVLDSLEHGYKEALPTDVTLLKGNVSDRKLIDQIFEKHKTEAVIHFAGYISMEESVREPQKYLRNNTVAPITLLESMAAHKIDKIIFSSTAGVYGNPEKLPIPEDHPKRPTNPYGLSKWFFEEVLSFYDRTAAIRSVSLRYFNAAGASLDGQHGEAHDPETHIIPIAMAAALGKNSEFYLYGTDYPTRDGTCVRDYIHVEDLCQSHLLALEALMSGQGTAAYNVGTGQGWSNRQVVAMIKKVTSIDFAVKEKPRRPGDATSLVADPTRLKKEFGWKPQYSDLEIVVKTAWKWHRTHPGGYTK